MMHTAVVFYFSGTGNTWWAAQRIIRQLDACNINASAVSMDMLTPKKADWWIKTADLVLFGWPSRASDMPLPVKRFIDALPVNEKGKHVHVFCTTTAFPGDGAWVAHKRLREKGLVVDTAGHFTMPPNMSMMRGPLGAPDEDTAKRVLAQAERQIVLYTGRLLQGRGRVRGRYSLPGALRRGLSRLFQKRASTRVGVDESRCTRCGVCESLCPVGNIRLRTLPVFAGHCAQCMRCYALCPSFAVTFSGRARNVEKNGKPYTVPDAHFKPSVLVK